MKYHIKFTYESKYGRSDGYVYAETKEDAERIIKDHEQDESKPKLVKWRLYELIEEADNDKVD